MAVPPFVGLVDIHSHRAVYRGGDDAACVTRTLAQGIQTGDSALPPRITQNARTGADERVSGPVSRASGWSNPQAAAPVWAGPGTGYR